MVTDCFSSERRKLFSSLLFKRGDEKEKRGRERGKKRKETNVVLGNVIIFFDRYYHTTARMTSKKQYHQYFRYFLDIYFYIRSLFRFFLLFLFSFVILQNSLLDRVKRSVEMSPPIILLPSKTIRISTATCENWMNRRVMYRLYFIAEQIISLRWIVSTWRFYFSSSSSSYLCLLENVRGFFSSFSSSFLQSTTSK